MRGAAALLAGLLLAVAAPPAPAHNGEYRPPLPPPIRDDEPPPGRKPGVTRKEGGTATLPPDAANPKPPRPEEVPPPAPPRAGADRDDDRLTVWIWWEANRHRFLPPPPALPRRQALLDALLAAAAREEEGVRRRALLALARAGDARALAPLVRAAKKGATIDRAFAVLSLGLLGGKEATAALRELWAADDAAHLRSFTVLALGLAGDPESADLVRNVLAAERSPNVRAAAALAAGLLRDLDAGSALARIVLGIHHLDGPEASRGPAVAARCAAARALSEVITPATYRQLLWAMKSAPVPVRVAAAMQLARAAGTAGVPALREALLPENPLSLREAVLLGLAGRGDEVALAEAIRLLESESEADRRLQPFAALALGISRFPDYAPRLREFMKDGKLAPDTRAAAALAIGLTGDEHASERLRRDLAGEKGPLLRSTGVVALARLGNPRAPLMAGRLLEAYDVPAPRRAAVIALGLAGDPESEDVLVEELADSYHVNREALLALARVAPDRAATELLAKLSDANPNAVRFAARCLATLLDRDRPGRLVALLASSNLLSLPPILRTCLYVENEYLNELLREW